MSEAVATSARLLNNLPPHGEVAGSGKPTERRPWGEYRVLDEGPGYKVKRIVVAPQGRLSLQSHAQRAEHWTVVAGEATVTVNGAALTLTRGQSVDIPKGGQHRLENFGASAVELIEVQLGEYLGEDDIVRHEDTYNRG